MSTNFIVFYGALLLFVPFVLSSSVILKQQKSSSTSSKALPWTVKNEDAHMWSNTGRPAQIRFGNLSDGECVCIGCQAVDENRVCVTPGCVQAAARLLGSIDKTADPCEDFYQFACGKWIDDHIIPEDKSQYSIFDQLIEGVGVSVKRLLENPRSTGVFTLEKVKNVYAACMDKNTINKLGVLPALELLKSNNIWPAVQPALYNEATYDLELAIANINRLHRSKFFVSDNDDENGVGVSALLSLGITPDFKNSTSRILSVDQAALGMPSRDSLLRGANDTTVQAYYQYMLSIAAILNFVKPTTATTTVKTELDSRARIERELPAVLGFEIALANITTPKELRRDPVRIYNKMTLAQLAQLIPGFNWLRLINLWLKDAGLQVNENEAIIVAEPEYLKNLLALIQKTPLRTIANYLGWRLIKNYVFSLDSSVQEVRLRYTTALTGVTQDPPRYKACSALASSAIPLGIGRLYVEHEFDEESKSLSKSLISNLRAAFNEQLDKIDWLGTVERQLSHEKGMISSINLHTLYVPGPKFILIVVVILFVFLIHLPTTMSKLLAAIIEQIGYDDKLLNDSWLNNFYALNVGNGDDHFGNTVANNYANVVFEQRRLREPVDRYAFERDPAAVNAFYNPTVNSIMFLAGILQSPFFSRSQPMSLNFGSIGYVMGHEVTHGFDDQGRQFDKAGRLNNWWMNATVKNFLNRTACVVDFYSNYTVKEVNLPLNGEFTLGENLADMGGLNAAYLAYDHWLAQAGGNEPALPGLQQFTNKQLFFLASATVWCGSERPEKLKQAILTDPHSPGRFRNRVNGPLSNMPEFSSAFNCPMNSNMNPKTKCRVW